MENEFKNSIKNLITEVQYCIEDGTINSPDVIENRKNDINILNIFLKELDNQPIVINLDSTEAWYLTEIIDNFESPEDDDEFDQFIDNFKNRLLKARS